MKAFGLYKSLSLTLVAISMVTSTACTRDKGGKEAQKGAPTTQTTPPAGEKVPGPGSPTIPGLDPEGPENSGSTEARNDGAANESGGDEARTGVIHYDPSGMNPDQIREASEAQGPVLVGPKSDLQDFAGNDLSYSGSGQDTLREVITAHVESREADQKQADAELVRRIKTASVDIGWNSRSMLVSVTIERSGHATEFTTRGSLTNRLTLSTPVPRLPGDVSFDATCMDLSGGCKTVHLMVQEKSVNGPRTAHILIRKTTGAFFLEATAADRHTNDEFNEMLEIMWLRDQKSVRRIEQLDMDTVEVIGGTSSFLVKMLARKNSYQAEWLMFSGPLVKPQTSSDTNVMVDVVGRGSLNRSIRDTRLTYNDGRGNLRVVVTVRKLRENEREASLTLTLARVHTPTRPIRLN